MSVCHIPEGRDRHPCQLTTESSEDTTTSAAKPKPSKRDGGLKTLNLIKIDLYDAIFLTDGIISCQIACHITDLFLFIRHNKDPFNQVVKTLLALLTPSVTSSPLIYLGVGRTSLSPLHGNHGPRHTDAKPYNADKARKGLGHLSRTGPIKCHKG